MLWTSCIGLIYFPSFCWLRRKVTEGQDTRLHSGSPILCVHLNKWLPFFLPMGQDTEKRFFPTSSNMLGPWAGPCLSSLLPFTQCLVQLWAQRSCTINICGRNECSWSPPLLHASQSTWIWMESWCQRGMEMVRFGVVCWIFFCLPLDPYFFPDPLLFLDLNSLPNVLHLLTNHNRTQTHCSPDVPATPYHRLGPGFCSTKIVPNFCAKYHLTHLLNATSKELSLTLFICHSH